jgi:hypothetical protein
MRKNILRRAAKRRRKLGEAFLNIRREAIWVWHEQSPETGVSFMITRNMRFARWSNRFPGVTKDSDIQPVATFKKASRIYVHVQGSGRESERADCSAAPIRTFF